MTTSHSDVQHDLRRPPRKPYITARAASELLGVTEAEIVLDIVHGFTDLAALIGGRFGDYWFLYADQLEGEGLELHRNRLQRAYGRTVEQESVAT